MLAETGNGKLIANTTLEQLGGNRFVAMTGAKNINYDHSGTLTFKLPIGKAGAVRIELTPEDLYRITFFKRRSFRVSSVHSGIYCDMLREIFESATGLRTSL